MNIECEMIYLNPSKGLHFINKKITTKTPATPFWFIQIFNHVVEDCHGNELFLSNHDYMD